MLWKIITAIYIHMVIFHIFIYLSTCLFTYWLIYSLTYLFIFLSHSPAFIFPLIQEGVRDGQGGAAHHKTSSHSTPQGSCPKQEAAGPLNDAQVKLRSHPPPHQLQVQIHGRLCQSEEQRGKDVCCSWLWWCPDRSKSEITGIKEPPSDY